MFDSIGKHKNRLRIFVLGICLFFLCLYLAFVYKRELYIYYNVVFYGPEIASIIDSRKQEMSRFYTNTGYLDKNVYIAHGGGLGEFRHTNCLEAVNDSINKKFKFIELDLLLTKDGHIVGAHDWKFLKKIIHWHDETDLPLSRSDILSLKRNHDYTPVFGSDIRSIIENSDIIFVTDKIREFKLLLDTIPYPDRLIVEVFTPQDYLNALRAGIKFPAYAISSKMRYEIARKLKFPIVTMAANIFFDDPEDIKLVQKMHDDGVTILLYHYYDPNNFETNEFAKKYLGKTVSKIYAV